MGFSPFFLHSLLLMVIRPLAQPLRPPALFHLSLFYHLINSFAGSDIPFFSPLSSESFSRPFLLISFFVPYLFHPEFCPDLFWCLEVRVELWSARGSLRIDLSLV